MKADVNAATLDRLCKWSVTYACRAGYDSGYELSTYIRISSVEAYWAAKELE